MSLSPRVLPRFVYFYDCLGTIGENNNPFGSTFLLFLEQMFYTTCSSEVQTWIGHVPGTRPIVASSFCMFCFVVFRRATSLLHNVSRSQSV